MTPPSPTVEPLEPETDTEQGIVPELPPPSDPRWICWQCGSLALLDDDGLCRNCWPERAASFVEICMRALNVEVRRTSARWRIC